MNLIHFMTILETPDGPLAVYVPHVSTGCLHAVVSRRSGHHQPLQTTAGESDLQSNHPIGTFYS